VNKVWLTRSQPGASRQAQELSAAGYQVLVAPVLTIEATGNPAPAQAPDLTIFLSEHAVKTAADLAFARSGVVFSVGAQTRSALAARGIDARIPAQQSSEGLLQLPELRDISGKRILLAAGEGGRELLAHTLQERGAQVEIYRVYRRVPVAALDLDPASIAAIVVASGDGLRAMACLWQNLGGKPDIPLLVPSARVADIAAELQFSCVIQCAGADSHAILSGLKQIPVL
jgi:uroporphyrinogen-III synthase